MKRNAILVCALVLVCGAFGRSALNGQEVRLRKGDLVKLEVAQREDLGRTLTIDAKGNVTLPIVGAVRLEGLTLDEAKAAMLRSLQELYPSIQSLTLTLIGEAARRYIFVQGQVARPGKFDLEGLLSVWDAIKEAGGTTGDGALESVRLIRSEADQTTTTIVNVQKALDSGDVKSIPALKPGDTIIVPERSAAYTGTGAVNVIGAVLHPAPYFLSGDKRLVDAILAAGGTAENANLRKVKIIRLLPNGGTERLEINFKRYLETGDLRQNPVILPNDTVSIPATSSWLVLADPRFLVGLITASATVIAIVLTRR